tara:strand:- start:64 stop:252 length:189 start_codon:yes stop_codon:yes gene_type:complete
MLPLVLLVTESECQQDTSLIEELLEAVFRRGEREEGLGVVKEGHDADEQLVGETFERRSFLV